MSSMNAVDICNLALYHCGHNKQINSLDENSSEARKCKRIYSNSRQLLLASAKWGFAKVYTSLSQTGNTPPQGWGYEYHYPAGALRILEIPRSNVAITPIPFTDGTVYDATHNKWSRVIWTNHENAGMLFLGDVTLESMFSIHFAQTLAAYMAFLLSKDIAQKSRITEQNWQLYQSMLSEAERVSAAESVDEEQPDASWIRNR